MLMWALCYLASWHPSPIPTNLLNMQQARMPYLISIASKPTGLQSWGAAFHKSLISMSLIKGLVYILVDSWLKLLLKEFVSTIWNQVGNLTQLPYSMLCAEIFFIRHVCIFGSSSAARCLSFQIAETDEARGRGESLMLRRGERLCD